MEIEAGLAEVFLEFSRSKLLDQFWPRLRECVESLTGEQLWARPNAASNSVGNLLLHLDGNVRQWLVAAFTGLEDRRDRPAEFAAKGGRTATDLLALLGETLERAAEVFDSMTVEQLLAVRTIQGYRVRGLEAVYQVVEHFGQHYGQIAYITKGMTGRDLGFYRELSQTGRVESGNQSHP